ncbi:CST complex subunit CTC1 isoform X2 [Lepisosteus oculatus]|uniref:CST complex subunit CTC1 isoform X2 n=1 Tax=Lepisosteus oculatus TaxID=7918 RepID=UPI00370FD522
MDEFLREFQSPSQAEVQWLQDVYCFTEKNLLPVGELAGSCVAVLALAVVRTTQQALGTGPDSVPLSYRLVSMGELVARQHTPCCSHVTWSTSQFREWAQEGERRVANCRVLPRDNLLLIGCLTDHHSSSLGREAVYDGSLSLKDGSGSLYCEVLHLSTDWLGRLMLFPNWNYIPQNAASSGQKVEGYLELCCPPLPILPSPLTLEPEEPLFQGALRPHETARLLKQRFRSPGVRLVVCGQVSLLCPLLNIAGKTFFCFTLSDRERENSVPMLVTNPSLLHWRQCLSVGVSVVISGLRVCTLRRVAAQLVLCPTPQSRLWPLKHFKAPWETPGQAQADTQALLSRWTQGQTEEQTLTDTETDEQTAGDTQTEGQTLTDTETEGQPAGDTQTEGQTLTDTETEEQRTGDTWTQEQTGDTQKEEQTAGDTWTQEQTAGQMDPEPDRTTGPKTDRQPVSVKPVLRCTAKRSKVIDYKGVISRVLIAEAGLYELDGEVGLCLAYQQVLNYGRGLRPGAEVKLSHVHFMYRPSPHFPPTLLCCCLRTALQIEGFSAVGSEFMPFHHQKSLYVRVLLERELGVSQYLWACHCAATLGERLCPRVVRPGRMRAVAGRFLRSLLADSEAGAPGRRDIYREMLEEPHCCPLVEYSANAPPPCQTPSVSELVSLGESLGWDSLCLPSLLPPTAPHLTSAELNPFLAWSVLSQPAWSLRPPAVLAGVLKPCGRSGRLQLLDQTGAVECVCVERDGDTQRALSDTAWIGCLVSVRRFSIVTERFLKTEFPSWRHLDQQQYIKERSCRVYVQFCVGDLELLSPSAAMSRLRSAGQTQSPGVRKTPGDPEGLGGARKTPGDPEGLGGARKTLGDPEGLGGARKRLRGVAEDAEESEWGAGVQSTKGAGPRAAPLSSSPACTLTSAGSIRSEVATPPPCVSVLFRVLEKEGLSFRNMASNQAPGPAGLKMSFGASAVLLGEPRVCAGDSNNTHLPPEETESGDNGAPCRVQLLFLGGAVRWFHLLQPGCLYRLVAPDTADPSILSSPSRPTYTGPQCPEARSLPVLPHWQIHTLALAPVPAPRQVSESSDHRILSVSEVLSGRTLFSLVSFKGRISQRITLQGFRDKTPDVQLQPSLCGVAVEKAPGARLTVCDCLTPWISLQVYIELSHNPYTPGLIPGATVLFQKFHRRVSRAHSVYCRSVPLSCVTVEQLGNGQSWPADSSGHPSSETPLPIMLLGEWGAGQPRCIMGRVRCHVVCVLFLQLQWVCSLCSSVFKQGRCTRNYPPCHSDSGVFQAEAKAVVEDGSGEAQVWFSTPTVPALLSLGPSEWEGLQTHIRARGHLRVIHRGRSPENRVSVQSEDLLLLYLSALCVSSLVCRSISLSCRLGSRDPSLRHVVSVLLQGAAR